ncbi:hypothetical protein [Mycobacterium shigaense]|uniref:hypothetical protein n=1 Tax=Mycobacterium shigaense TaxID=722731 RepID=UPI002AE04ADA|nr:hypothetical protein [Mycobacterium shigaense]MEA1123896.1 hypothetical protein [Mycobacterium shigaense]
MSAFAEQPLPGFAYDYWFECRRTNCRKRVHIPEAVVSQLKSYGTRSKAIWTGLTEVLESEYLPEVNDQVRSRFRGALEDRSDPVQYHQEIRLLGTLLSRPHDVIAKLAQAQARNINL